MITTIGLDADDTLWHNETIFEGSNAKLRALLTRYHHDAAEVDRRLFATEMRNLELYGYGIKSFTLSAIETAVELSGRQISAEEILAIIHLAQNMLAHPVNILDGVIETVTTLSESHRLVVITKGDLRDQERKIARSGLAAHFAAVEILSEKNPDTYGRVLRRHGIAPGEFLMVGNSIKSDILPVLALGGAGAHVPYHLTWEHERVDGPPEHPRFFPLGSIRDLPDLLGRLS
jgi:putative hydrolase of the HAD superfamily